MTTENIKNESNKYIVFEVSGGIGRNIFSTAVISAMKKQYPDRKIIVQASWPEALINNPNIYRVYRLGVSPYFYEDFIENKDTIVFAPEPYKDSSYIKEEKHIVETWCNQVGLTYNGEKPELFVTPAEEVNTIVKAKNDKPILVIQPFGGGAKSHVYSWNRDIPINQAQQLVDFFSKEFNVYQLSTKEQPSLQNAIKVDWNLRECFVLLKYAKAVVSCDSFSHHACAALNKSAVVCWISNKPSVFGYKRHVNVCAKMDDVPFCHYVDSGLQKYSFGGERMYDFPFKTINVFDLKEIVDGVKTIVNAPS